MKLASQAAERVDVAIVGGGIVGLSLAVALKIALQDLIRVELWDPGLGRRSPPQRVSAITAGSRRFLERLQAWRLVADYAQPIVEMAVSDSRLDDPVRNALLLFNSELDTGERFAHMAPNSALEHALEQTAAQLGVVAERHSATGVELHGSANFLSSSTGKILRARLVVAADGRASPVRRSAGIKCVAWDYGLTGIVCTIAHELDHFGRARQDFLPSGPFAILPLRGRQSSIVWTERRDVARRLLDSPDSIFEGELRRRFGKELGATHMVDKPIGFDLGFQMARSLVDARLALVGDAAHVIHPVAGQGLNLGLRDAAALAETITDQLRLGLDPGSPDALEKYQRMRRFDNMSMAVATDALHRIFGPSEFFRWPRDIGLGLVDRAPALKRFFTQEAAGVLGAPSWPTASHKF